MSRFYKRIRNQRLEMNLSRSTAWSGRRRRWVICQGPGHPIVSRGRHPLPQAEVFDTEAVAALKGLRTLRSLSPAARPSTPHTPPPPTTTANVPWWEHLRRMSSTCSFCGIALLSQERDGWCCHRGRLRLPQLPPCDDLLRQLDDRYGRDLSRISRRLNNLSPSPPSALSVALSPSTASRTSMHWFLYDETERGRQKDKDGLYHFSPNGTLFGWYCPLGRRAGRWPDAARAVVQILCSLTIPACYEANSDDVETDVFIPTQVRFYADLSLSSDLAPEALIYAWGSFLTNMNTLNELEILLHAYTVQRKSLCRLPGHRSGALWALHYRMRVIAYNASTRSSDSFPVAVYLKNGKRWQNFPLLSSVFVSGRIFGVTKIRSELAVLAEFPSLLFPAAIHARPLGEPGPAPSLRRREFILHLRKA
ncbi:hypothetical protein V8E54_007940 [Elaphomyces granulatus]